MTVAVQGGHLKVFHNIEGHFSGPINLQESKIGNAQARFVSETLYLFLPDAKIVSLSFIDFNVFCVFCFQFDVIIRRSRNEMLVRLDRHKIYTLTSEELSFPGRYFLGGVPEDMMPER